MVELKLPTLGDIKKEIPSKCFEVGDGCGSVWTTACDRDGGVDW